MYCWFPTVVPFLPSLCPFLLWPLGGYYGSILSGSELCRHWLSVIRSDGIHLEIPRADVCEVQIWSLYHDLQTWYLLLFYPSFAHAEDLAWTTPANRRAGRTCWGSLLVQEHNYLFGMKFCYEMPIIFIGSGESVFSTGELHFNVEGGIPKSILSWPISLSVR